MSGHMTDKFTYLGGAVKFKDLFMFSLKADALDYESNPRTYFSANDQGGWCGFGKEPWPMVSMCYCTIPKNQFAVLGPHGHVMILGSKDNHPEVVGEGDGGVSARGPLTRVRTIAGKAYAVGMDRQVYRRDDANRWTCIDQSARPGPKEVKGFESIDGFRADDIYAVGYDGDIFHWNGKAWRQIDSPTNLILTDVCCAADGQVYIVGQMGTIIRGRGDRWEVLDHGGGKAHLWNCAVFQGRLYTTTNSKLLHLGADGKLVPVDFGDDLPGTVYHLATGDGILLSIGAKDVMSFDGTTWTRID